MRKTQFYLSILFMIAVALISTQSVFAVQEDMILGTEEMELPKISEDEISEILDSQKSQEKVELVTPKAPAPALTYLQIDYVGSSNIGWELISPSQMITVGDHGGSIMYVRTIELGYGCNPIAKMGGGQLPWSSNFQTYQLCWNASGNLVICEPGQTVVGFMRYWDVSGWQNGYFTYQKTSCNFHNTMSDAISIR
jgi:hypothetical protein